MELTLHARCSGNSNETLYEEHVGIISIIFHGTLDIVNLKRKKGHSLVAGKKVNGFSEKFEN